MLKEQNVIKLLLTLSFFCLSFKLYCQQEIDGKYSSLMLNQEHYNYFDFNKNGIFEYHAGADLGEIEFGKGHYQIKNDSLILNYDLTKLNKEGYFKTKKFYNSNDSIKINLKIYNLNKEPLSNVMVYSFPTYSATQSNKKGTASLKFKKQRHKDKIKLYVEEMFLSKQVMYLDGDSNYNIDVFMNKSVEQFGHPKAIKNQIIKYKIIEHAEDFIKIKKENRVIKLIRQSK